MTVSGGLAALLEQATPGPWEAAGTHVYAGERYALSHIPIAGVWTEEYDASLIALAPDMASLLIDTAAWVEKAMWARTAEGSGWFCRWCSLDKSLGHADGCDAGALLARFAALEQKAETT